MNVLAVGSAFFAKFLPITYAVIGFSLVVVVHEFGHFLFCQMFNVHTPTFSVGFGPTIAEKKIGKTNFKFSAIPLGGYVEISGVQEVGQGEQEHAQDTGETAFRSKPYWQKFIILTGGVAFNFLFAYLVFVTLFMTGIPKSEIRIKSVVENSAAQEAGLESKDKIIMIGKSDIAKNPSLLLHVIQKIQKLSNEKISMVVERDGDRKELEVLVPANGPTGEKPKYKLGIEFDYVPTNVKERFGFVESIKKGAISTSNYMYLTLYSLKMMFTKRSLKGAGGPVMIFSESVKVAQKGLTSLFIFLAIISIGLGIFNLVPLPILDGGQLFFTTIEAIIRREIPINIKQAIHVGSVFLMLALFIYLTYTDILYIIKERLG